MRAPQIGLHGDGFSKPHDGIVIAPVELQEVTDEFVAMTIFGMVGGGAREPHIGRLMLNERGGRVHGFGGERFGIEQERLIGLRAALFVVVVFERELGQELAGFGELRVAG